MWMQPSSRAIRLMPHPNPFNRSIGVAGVPPKPLGHPILKSGQSPPPAATTIG
jgi:hypothetical protein